MAEIVEELEGLYHPGENGFGSLGRQSDGEGAVGIGPCGKQHRYLSASHGEIDIDVPEVALQPLARIMHQRDERLSLAPAMLADVSADLVVAADVAMLVAQPPENLSGRVSLLAWRLLVRLQNLVDDRRKRPQFRRGWVLRARVSGQARKVGRSACRPSRPPRPDRVR